MNLSERFCRFFAEANDGRRPYPWQLALLERVAAAGRWPSAITAPTGSGKSSVIDIHVFLVAERARLAAMADDCTAVHRPPRRLVLIAPRRVLVDDQHLRAVCLAELLADAPEDTALGEAHCALVRLTTSKQNDGRSLGVARLRGGVRLDRSWRLDPGQCQVICATPEMWGSRLLLRGFRASRRSRNLESGLLCEDVAVVIDEAHLHTRLVDTARRVAAECSSPSRLQVVGMTATPAGAITVDGVGLTTADDADEQLVRRVDAKKRVTVERIEDWSRGRGDAVAEAARALRFAHPDAGTVGVFVNTVSAALGVAARLGDAEPEREVRIVCGRMRPADLQLLRTEDEGLLDARGNSFVDFLVSTQSLEVGVDLDLGAIVSELAPASALAQRLGRLNRSGIRRDSTFVVLAPQEDAVETLGPRLAPYRVEQMRDALAWLDALGGDGSPRNVSQTPLPPDDSVPLPAITSVELTTLAMTSPVLAADPEVDFYIADPIECDQVQVQIAARRYLDDHDLPVDIVRATLLRAPPRSHELASVSLPVPIPLPILKRSWVLSYDGGVLTADEWTKQIADPLRDGDVLVIPGDSPVLTKGIVDLRPGESMRDVMESVEDGEPDRVIRLSGPDAESLEALVARDPVLGTRSSRREVAQLLDGAGLSDVAKRLRVHRYLSELSVTWCGSNESQAGLLVVIETGRDGQEARRTVGEKPVKLDAHNRDVADRTAEIIRSLDGAVAQERDDLLLAARLHDIGKCHPEFQRRMGASPDGPALAKPAPGHVPDQGKGWRHEQLSTAWARAEGAGLLTQAVVAAHHGAGRPMFDDDDEAARLRWDGCPHDVVTALAELFGPYGAFEREREVLQRKLGVHRMAFLEALLRCADMQISSEVNE